MGDINTVWAQNVVTDEINDFKSKMFCYCSRVALLEKREG